MWALLELLKCSVQTASGKEKGHPSCEHYTEHYRACWTRAQCNTSNNLVLVALGQRLVLRVKYDSLVIKCAGD